MGDEDKDAVTGNDPEDFIDLGDDQGDEGAGQADQEPAGSDASGSDDAKPAGDWKPVVDRLERENAELRATVLGTLSQLAGRLGEAQQPAAPVKESQKLTPEQWKALVQQAPQALPDVIRAELAGSFDQKFEELRASILGGLQRDRVDQHLGSILERHYAKELANPQSPLYREAAEMKAQLAGMLDPSVRGTIQHDKLATLLALAASPNIVAKNALARRREDEQRRQKKIDRLTQMAGISRGGQIPEKEPELDTDLANLYGINLGDEKVKTRLARNVKAMKLRTVGEQR